MGICNCKQWYKIHQLNQSTNEIPLFTFAGMKCYGKVVDVYDGDTFKVCLYHDNKIIKINCRAFGYDSFEMKPKLNIIDRDAHIKKAKEAKQYLTDLLEATNHIIYVHCYKFDKYGRVLVMLYSKKSSIKSINDIMIETGHGIPYYGGKKTDLS